MSTRCGKLDKSHFNNCWWSFVTCVKLFHFTASVPDFTLVEVNCDNENWYIYTLYLFRLEVHFKGFPPPIISWYRDNFEIQPSHDFQINTTETVSTLSIPEVFPEDTGMFMVKAYNMYGTVQCKAKLTVVGQYHTNVTSLPNHPYFYNGSSPLLHTNMNIME